MAGNKSRESVVEFLDYLAQKGLMAHATVQARKAAVNAVLGILEEQEAQDVISINLDDVMTRFGNLQGKGYTPKSLVTYKSRVRAALEDFASYVDNPLAFKPNIQARERRQTSGKPSSSTTRNDSEGSASDVPRPTVQAFAGPMASSILPIPIRADLTIHIQGLPFDLTTAEAKKIANVIQAMAMPM